MCSLEVQEQLHISFFVSEWSDLSYQLPSGTITQVCPSSCFVYCKCTFGSRRRVQSPQQQQTGAYSRVNWEVWKWDLQGTQWEIHTFIHVFGKPVEDPPSGCRVKELHGAPQNPSEELIMEPWGCSESSLTMQKTLQCYKTVFAFLPLHFFWHQNILLHFSLQP